MVPWDDFLRRVVGDDIKPIYNRLLEVAKGIYVVAGKNHNLEPFDSCWIIQNEHGEVLASSGSVFVFSSHKIAKELADLEIVKCFPAEKHWNELVESFQYNFFDVIVDVTIPQRHYRFIPLKKKIILLQSY